MEFLRWLEGIRTPVLTFLMEKLTYCGSEVALMAVAIVVFWCVNKKWGYYIMTVGFFSIILSQFLKLVYRIPRPWVLDPNFSIVEAARADARGYSFPSGHTFNSVITFGGIALCSKKIWVRIVCVVLLLLIPFSRMYLGVHTPLDVGVAFGAALLLLFVFYPFAMKADEHPGRMYILFGLMLVCAAAYILYVNFGLSAESFGSDAEELANYTDGVKNSWSLTGALLGLLATWFYDSRVLKFEVSAPFLGQVCKVVLGLLCVMAIRLGLSALFSAIFPGQLFWSLPRYFLMVIMAGCIWPRTFPFFRRLGAKKAV